MTIDEARAMVEKHYWSQYAISKIAEAIVSAVSAERRAALTEAFTTVMITPTTVPVGTGQREEIASALTALRDSLSE